MTNKIDDRAFRFTAHTIIVVFGRRTVGRFGGFCIVDVNVQNFLGHTHDVYYTLSHKYFVFCGSCSRLFALASGWVTRDYMQQSCTFCHRRESCSRPRGFYSEMTSMTVGRHGGSHYPMRASIPANAGMCGNSEFVLYIQCHQIRSTSRQPGTDTEKTRERNTVNQSFELIHALLHLASP